MALCVSCPADDDGTIGGDGPGDRESAAEGAEVSHDAGGPAEGTSLPGGDRGPADDDGTIGGDGVGLRTIAAEIIIAGQTA